MQKVINNLPVFCLVVAAVLFFLGFVELSNPRGPLELIAGSINLLTAAIAARQKPVQ